MSFSVIETCDSLHYVLALIQDREPDSILLDITMPYVSGFELIGELRRDGYEMPVIFLTAQDTIEAKLRGFELGAEDYITKPYNHHEVVAWVSVFSLPLLRANTVSMRASKAKIT